MLKNIFSEHFYLVNEDDRYFINGSDAAAKSFLRYVENFIPVSMGRKITWKDSDFLLPRSRPHIKNRRRDDLNDKEIAIIRCLNDAFEKKEWITSLELCSRINWGKGKIPTAYFRYLNKYKHLLDVKKFVVNGKSSTKYRLKEKYLITA